MSEAIPGRALAELREAHKIAKAELGDAASEYEGAESQLHQAQKVSKIRYDARARAARRVDRIGKAIRIMEGDDE